jgi:cytochrome P450
MQTTAPQSKAIIPGHVRPDQVFEFDMYFDEGLLADLHQGYYDLQHRAPEVFWSPLNGGHWVVARGALVQQVLKDTATFSSVELDIPASNNPHRQIPINLDPPEHGPYRAMLMKYFTPKVVKALEETMQRWATTVIDRAYAQGHCEFTEKMGAAFPVHVFMEMMGLPIERFADFRSIVTEFFSHIPAERRQELSAVILKELNLVVDARIAEPKDDMISKLLSDEIKGQKLTRDEILSIGFLLFVAGLDTVANMMSFIFHFLAQRPDLQDMLREEPDKVAPFIDESLRRFPIVTLARKVTQDTEIGGTSIKAGEMIHAPLPLFNLDDRIHDDPMTFDLDRKHKDHLTFSVGPHLCMGHFLARSELRMFVTEFIKRIPRFRLPEGFKPHYRAGIIMAIENLELEWDVG